MDDERVIRRVEGVLRFGDVVLGFGVAPAVHAELVGKVCRDRSRGLEGRLPVWCTTMFIRRWARLAACGNGRRFAVRGHMRNVYIVLV